MLGFLKSLRFRNIYQLLIIAEAWVMICKISRSKYLNLHNLCLDIHSLYRKLSKCITCSTFSDFWWNVKWLLFTHSDTFQVEGKLHLYKYQLDWIIKRAINLNPTCVDKIMVMEACLHLSTSYLPRNLIRDFGILASREVKSGQRWPSTRLHTIYIQLTVWCRYTAKICGCRYSLLDISSVCLSPPPPLTHHLQLLMSPPPVLNFFT